MKHNLIVREYCKYFKLDLHISVQIINYSPNSNQNWCITIGLTIIFQAFILSVIVLCFTGDVLNSEREFIQLSFGNAFGLGSIGATFAGALLEVLFLVSSHLLLLKIIWSLPVKGFNTLIIIIIIITELI